MSCIGVVMLFLTPSKAIRSPSPIHILSEGVDRSLGKALQDEYLLVIYECYDAIQRIVLKVEND